MSIIKQKDIKIQNTETQPFLADAFFKSDAESLPLVIFVHGYKGYKDWGAWDLVAEAFAEAGFYFVKFNFSHNGTTLNSPLEFTDLEAFAKNTYSKELSDLKSVIDWFSNQPQVDASSISLIGHSRGGGISIVKTLHDERINKLVTWASVETLDRFPKGDAFTQWKKDGVYYSLNGRTQQEMPHYFQFFEDYKTHKNQFDVETAMELMKAKTLIIHGTKDEAVDSHSAEVLHHWNPRSELVLIENAGHTFGAKEPWESSHLPQDLEKVVQASIDFLR